jgi:ABC-type transport system involved in multi-copper enzyme maturation permease subunit
MMWMAWRQFRTQAAVVFAALMVLAVVLVVTGLRLRHLYDVSGITGCSAAGDCDTVTTAFTNHYRWLQTLLGDVLIQFLPAVTGVFWGAPLLAREFDTGTYRLAWTQTITRTRWLAAKIAVVGTASVAASGLLSWLVTWWSTPLDGLSDTKFDPSIFSERDVVPLGYAAFAFALGLIAGLLIRRTLPAMATTLVGYITARLVVLMWIRPQFAAPLHVTASMPEPGSGPAKAVKAPAAGQIPPGSWIGTSRITDPTGHSVAGIRITPGDPCVANHNCLAGYHQTITYQPPSRYWPFQWSETALFAGVAVILIVFSFWWINGHRLPGARRRTAAPTRPDAASHTRKTPVPTR